MPPSFPYREVPTPNLALFPERPLYRVGSVVELVAQSQANLGMN